MDVRLIPQGEFRRVRAAPVGEHDRLALLAEMCRFNALSMVKRAGSGHLGSSFSAMDIVAWLYFKELNTFSAGIQSPDRDIYFSSKGHDVPGLYAVLFAGGVLTRDQVLKLRRLGGLDGHPEVQVPGIEANSGSLGMGISKGKGMVWAKRALSHRGRVFVLVGDGELQEGQNYEALTTAAAQRIGDLTVIVDHNKAQTDKLVCEIIDLGDLEEKFRSFGWNVWRCAGHSFPALEQAYAARRAAAGKPGIIIADTVKGRGVSFMEHTSPESWRDGVYRWHSGAPDDETFSRASDEILARVAELFRRNGLGEPEVELVSGERAQTLGGVPKEYVAEAYGDALVAAGERRRDLVVLDGDLAADCRIRKFAERFPERFIENGIAEQDMVSMAGGLARSGLLPVVNSFASFLAARANEQIYNNATEGTKIIYACHFGGLIPAGPGKSHQSVRDISLFGALPNCTIIQPGNPEETRRALDYLVDQSDGVGVLRLAIGPSPRKIDLPRDYAFAPGRGTALTRGGDTVLFAYGPVMLHEALVAAETLAQDGAGLTVVNFPWLNRIDRDWVARLVSAFSTICVLEDHGPVGGLADRLLEELVGAGLLEGRRFRRFAVEGYPVCGAPGEVLRHHGLEGSVLAARIRGAAVHRTTADDRAYTLEAPQ
ncbi:MAG: 1-deoxy-D-xylulose-5-phosphate synthase [Gemmatimonadetes bacterium]|nr:1-deoxy-D-xylulose-5-phosphate synthase [Gemmatimonadota bacterium]